MYDNGWLLAHRALAHQPIRRLENTFKNQRELKVKPRKLPKARENTGDQVVIGFSFVSDWLREYMALVLWTNHRAEWGKSKAIPDYFRHPIKNRSALKSTQKFVVQLKKYGSQAFNILDYWMNINKCLSWLNFLPLYGYDLWKNTFSVVLNGFRECIHSRKYSQLHFILIIKVI